MKVGSVMDRWKNKESNYCQDRNIRPLVAALGRGERKDLRLENCVKERDTKMNLITPSAENLLLEYEAHETTFKTFNRETRAKCN